MRNLRLLSMIAAFAFSATTVCAPLQSEAQTAAQSTITGQIVDRQTNLPIPGATITLLRGNTAAATTVTDASGTFAFTGQNPGVYYVTIAATGFETVRSGDIAVAAGGTGTVRLSVAPASVGAGDLKTIGRSSTVGQAQTLQSSSTISRDIDSNLLQRENYIRIADALQTLPGVTLGGQSSSVGDDIYVNIRGLKPSETQLLLDGHPIGPIGVVSSTSGGSYDLQDSPSFAIRNTQVTFGAGPTALYGSTTIGGTVDLQTINPSTKPQLLLTVGGGDYGRQETILQGTGTVGKLGFALVHGVTGTYGNFSGTNVTQQGTLGGLNDFTSATTALVTYPESGAYILRNDLAKLTYQLTPSTQLSLTTTNANSWANKTGEGDNDFVTPIDALYNGQQNATPTAACPSGLIAATDANPNTCFTPAQYAAYAAGPAGGGFGAWQAINDQDYHARLTQSLGANTLVLDSFINNYAVIYHRDAIATGPFQQNLNQTRSVYKTYGNLISDDFVSGRNDFGVGFYQQTQKSFVETSYSDATAPNGATSANYPNGGIGVGTTLYNNQQDYFIRDNFEFSTKLSAFLNAWAEHSGVTAATYFEPRLSFVYRPTANDVVRLTGGQSDGIPAVSTLVSTGNAATFAPFSTSLNCNAQQLYSAGSTANPNLLAEKANDVEVAYGHRFYKDTSINVDVYNTNVTNQIFTGIASAGPFLSQIPASTINADLMIIHNRCGINASTANLGVSTNFNAATAKAQGIELSGRLRVNDAVYFESYYDVSSTVQNGVATSVLAKNPVVTNGGQIVGVPLQKASLSFDANDGKGGEFRIDEYYIGNNNDLYRPAYTFANLTLSKTYGRTLINLGVSNVFDNAVDVYGRIGYGTTPLLNPFFATNPAETNGISGPTNERFGLPPRSFNVSVQQRI